MQLTGEITSGAVAIILTIVSACVAWWIKSDRQSTKFDVLIAAMQRDIQVNRDTFSAQLVEIRAEFKSYNKSVEDIKLQLAAITATQSMGAMFANLPQELARAVGDVQRRNHERRTREREDAE